MFLIRKMEEDRGGVSRQEAHRQALDPMPGCVRLEAQEMGCSELCSPQRQYGLW